MFKRDRISFRPLKHDDLMTMFQWMRDPEVSRWYGPAPLTLAEIQARYGPRIDGARSIDCYLALYDGSPVAYIQSYPISHQPGYAAALDVDPGAIGVDMFIGEAGFRYHGFGPLMLQEFVRRIVFADTGVSYCVIAPEVNNQSAIRAYEKAGFQHIKTVPVPGEEEPEYVMMLRPDELQTRVDTLDDETANQ